MTRLPGKLLSLIILTWLSVPAIAAAHVVVKPSVVETATYQIFTVSVPNEKSLPTTELELVVPVGLQSVTPSVKPGWKISTVKSSNSEEAVVTKINWTGGSIPEGQRDDFSFSAKTPDNPTGLVWKAYQTYADGLVVSWDVKDGGHDEEASDSGPASLTSVLAEKLSIQSDNSVDSNNNLAKFALLLSVLALVSSLMVFMNSNSKKS